MLLRLAIFIIIALAAQISNAQVFGFEHMITSLVPGVSSIHSVDLDGDGDKDVLSASYVGDKIAWYENLGDGIFDDQVLISTQQDFPYSVYSTDLDNDGDMDVLAASQSDDIVAWYENLGGGLFSSMQVISTLARIPTCVYADDLDGDSDMDVLSSSLFDLLIACYSNSGDGSFGPQQTITTEANGSFAVYAADLDNDGDQDALSASLNDDKIAWYMNNGSGVFGAQQIISTDVDGAYDVRAVDLDGDEDMDVLAASKDGDAIVWFENLGGGNFGVKQIITLDIDSPTSVFAADMDQDGDMDVLSSSNLDDKIAWYRNLGGGNFSSQIIISDNVNGASCVYAADMDGDGDLDVLAASSFDDEISWFENLPIQGCTEQSACNYEPEATLDDGSCCFSNCGCTNPLAANYSEDATCDNGGCYFRVTGTVFFDENGNGEMDGNDYGLPFRTVVLEETGQTYITNDDGNFLAIVPQDHIATFELFNTIPFPYNTTPNPRIFNPNASLSTQLMFGVTNSLPVYGIGVDFYPSGNNFLCNAYINYNICFRNLGNVPIDGIVKLEYDPLFQGYQEVTPIDSVVGNTIFMSYQNLLPGQMFFYDVELLTPTVEHIGESVTNVVQIYGYFEGELVAYGDKVGTMQITCAYDPNDKQAFPLGYTDDHLLLPQTEQEFLIRFQNTGNAPAQNIRIQDTLDVNFNISSFRMMANSHSVMTTIDPQTRLVDFYFENIQLPDSVSNEPASHGLISYKITPLPGLPAGTVLENTAYIYFDNNEPIVTNTTWTTIHECGGEAAFESATAIICDEPQVNFESTYDFVEQYSWQLDGEDVGVNPELLLTSLDNPDYEVTLTASNPLCTETVTLNYEVPDIAMIDPCRADFNCDGNRDTEDLLIFIGEFGCLNTCAADLDSNAIVNVADLFILVSVFDQDCWE